MTLRSTDGARTGSSLASSGLTQGLASVALRHPLGSSDNWLGEVSKGRAKGDQDRNQGGKARSPDQIAKVLHDA
jgi:hypothetical protein